ncbi:MAG: hypothetical protein MJZ90_02450 [Bacteroidales bacterium]|nr:hypothetical protein [Bacteroidales bacterium]
MVRDFQPRHRAENCRIASGRECHPGIGHSKSLEHRLFSQITRSWSGTQLLSIEDATRRAAETTTSKGLTVYVDINTKTYDIQRPIDESYERERRRRIIPMDALPKWNYLVKRS